MTRAESRPGAGNRKRLLLRTGALVGGLVTAAALAFGLSSATTPAGKAATGWVHDDTGKLCATGYEMNQESTLEPEEEFVFGQFVSPQLRVATQVSIRSIEARSGISFGRLAGVDPLAGGEEGVGEGLKIALEALEQIRFV